LCRTIEYGNVCKLGIDNGEEEMKNATNPNIRFFTVPKLTATTPQNNLLGNWTESTPETMKNSAPLATSLPNA
jgi:hypothetical protein